MVTDIFKQVCFNEILRHGVYLQRYLYFNIYKSIIFVTLTAYSQ